MATLSFSITVADADVARVIPALRYAFGAPNATISDLVELVRKEARDRIVGIVRTYEENQALTAAAIPPAPINAT